MRSSAPGFLLLELALYLAATAIAAVLLFDWYFEQVARASRQPLHGIQLESALSLLQRDLVGAQSAAQKWQLKEGVFATWVFDAAHQRIVERAVCWQRKKDNLVRIVGDYNFENKLWRNKKVAIVAPRVTAWEMMGHQDGDVGKMRGVTIFWTHHASTTQERYFALVNGAGHA